MRYSAHVSTPGLLAAVESLAVAIRKTPNWQKWRDADQAAERNSELASKLTRYHVLSARLRAGAMSNQDLLEYGELQRQIENPEVFRRRDETAAELVELLVTVNGMLSERIGLDFAAAAAPRSSCCG